MYTSIADNNFVVSSKDSPFFVLNDLIDSHKRRKSVDFHVKNDDYFAVLATIIKAIASEDFKKENELLDDVSNDLIYLQKNYMIVRK